MPRKHTKKRRKKLTGQLIRARSTEFNLVLDTNNLKAEIQRLVLKKRMLAQMRSAVNTGHLVPSISTSRVIETHVCSIDAMVRQVQTYAKVFQHALQPGSNDHNTSANTIASAAVVPSPSHYSRRDQIAFLHRFLSDDIDIDDGHRGIDYVVHQWDLYSAVIRNSTIFPLKRSVELLAADGRCPIFKIQRNYQGFLTADTFRLLFPRLAPDSPLRVRLEGRHVQLTTQYLFQFDGQTGRVCRLTLQVNWLSEIAKVIADPVDLATLFNQATLGNDSMLQVDASALCSSPPLSPQRRRSRDPECGWTCGPPKDPSADPLRPILSPASHQEDTE